MLIDFFLNGLYQFVVILCYPILSLSDVSINSDLTSALYTATTYIYSFNEFAPLSTIYTIMTVEIGFETGVFAYKFIMWLIRRLPTQS